MFPAFTSPSSCTVSFSTSDGCSPETLDLPEEVLLEFSGTLLVVSHERKFVDHVVTSNFVFEGGGRVGEYVGGYTAASRACR